MGLKKFLLPMLGMVSSFALLPSSAFADIQIKGGTSGSAFYNGSVSQGSSLLNLAFTSASFGPQSSNSPVSLGSFYLSCGILNICSDNYNSPNYSFDLKVSFQVPLGTSSPTTVVGDLKGNLAGFFVIGTNTVGVDFGGPELFTYTNSTGSGQFYLTVNDINPGTMQVNGNTALTGAITGVTFNPVPEPGSVVFLGTLVAGMGLLMRKRLSGLIR